jgi:DNA-binding transcriptional MerR regulator
MRIGVVARQLGVSVDWLKNLEREQRIPEFPRDLNGHRRLTQEDVARVRALLFQVRGAHGTEESKRSTGSVG